MGVVGGMGGMVIFCDILSGLLTSATFIVRG